MLITSILQLRRPAAALLFAGFAGCVPGARAQQSDFGHEWTVAHRSPEDRVEQGGRIELAGVCKMSGYAMEEAAATLARRVPPGDSAFHVRAKFPVGDDGRWSGAVEVPWEAPVGPYRLSVFCNEQDQAGHADDFHYEVMAASGPRPATSTTSPPAAPTSTTARRAADLSPTTTVAAAPPPPVAPLLDPGPTTSTSSTSSTSMSPRRQPPGRPAAQVAAGHRRRWPAPVPPP